MIYVTVAGRTACPHADTQCGTYLGVVQQHLPTVLHGQVGLLLLPGVLVEGELPRHLGQPEQRVGVEFALELLQTVQLLK